MRTDILILGGGLTALAAADTAVREGALQVDLLQCGSGASPYIHGFCLPMGPGDSEELLVKDTLESGCGQSNEALVRALCAGSLALTDYFRELGLDVDRENGQPRLLHSLGSSVPRIAGIENATGPAVMKRLRRRLSQHKNYREHGHQRAMKLLMRGGRVIGARCYDLQTEEFYNFYARSVILATGGFCRIFPESTNSAEMGGDGIAMAYEAGGALTDMEFVQFEPCAAVWPEAVAGKGIITTLFYNGAVLRGRTGERFMPRYSDKGERVSKDVLSRCIADEILKNGASEHGGVYFDATAVPRELWEGAYAPYLQRYLNCGIDLRTTPVEIAPAAHTSCGGVVIDENCRTGIPGLIACGEVAGGLHGANRLGGNAGLETMMFGPIAGRAAVADAADLEEHGEERQKNRESDVDIRAMRITLEETVRDSLNVIRNAERLRRGMETVDELLTALGDPEGSFEKYRLYNDLLTVKATMHSALARENSVGCHCREDSVEMAPWRVVIRKEAGQMCVLREKV